MNAFWTLGRLDQDVGRFSHRLGCRCLGKTPFGEALFGLSSATAPTPGFVLDWGYPSFSSQGRPGWKISACRSSASRGFGAILSMLFGSPGQLGCNAQLARLFALYTKSFQGQEKTLTKRPPRPILCSVGQRRERLLLLIRKGFGPQPFLLVLPTWTHRLWPGSVGLGYFTWVETSSEFACSPGFRRSYRAA